MAVQLKVNTDIMESMAVEMETEIGKIEKNFRDIQNTMINTGNYWRGDAGDADRKGFAGLQEQIDEIVKSFKNQPVKLRTIAGIMIKVEESNTQVATGLSKEDFV